MWNRICRAMAPPQQQRGPRMMTSNYRVLKPLGKGDFGKVIQCYKLDTSEVVAIKIPLDPTDDEVKTEMSMILKLMPLDLDKSNIVRCHDVFEFEGQTCLAFEPLDMTILDYMERRPASLPLSEIRAITQQMATALDALKGIGVIHTDLKLENVMLVDHVKQPLRVKVIDFGCALMSSEAEQGMTCQPRVYRSPEVILGLPFSYAIDMWSLGCMTAAMYLNDHLFPGMTEHHTMQLIVQLLGQPADHLLAAGLRSKKFFRKRRFLRQTWKFKTPKGHLNATSIELAKNRFYKLRSLDDLRYIKLNKVNTAQDMGAFVDLLKRMLDIDANKRITPSEVLVHPFITRSYLYDDSHHSSPSEAPPPAISMHRPSETVDERLPEPRNSQTQSRVEDTKKRTEADECPQPLMLKSSSCQKSLREIHLNVPVITEGAPSPDMPEDGAPEAGPAVDSATAEYQAALNSAHTTSDGSKRKKKTRLKRVRSFFSRGLRGLCCWCAPKMDDVE